MNRHTIDANLRDACLTLFGSEINVSRDFFSYLQPEGVKAAFRRKARETHPDALVGGGPLKTGGNEDFHKVTAAYQLLSSFVTQKGLPVSTTPKPPKPTADTHASSATTTRTNPEAGESSYYKGPLPNRQLELGRYLYYRGIIPYQTLINAVIWQRKQRPSLGRIARSWGWLNEAKVQTILCSRSHIGCFGERAVKLGFLTEYQLRILLSHQRSCQQKIGKFFVQAGFLSPQELDRLIQEQRLHNARSF